MNGIFAGRYSFISDLSSVQQANVPIEYRFEQEIGTSV